VPYLKEIDSFSLFFDYEMLGRVDIKQLFYMASCIPDKAVHIVKQDFNPVNDIKYLGQKQYSFSVKNWWFVVIWDCSRPKNQALLFGLVNNETNAELHRFIRLTDEEIGNLDLPWKWLV
jgi:hypothetical protein